MATDVCSLDSAAPDYAFVAALLNLETCSSGELSIVSIKSKLGSNLFVCSLAPRVTLSGTDVECSSNSAL